MLFRSTRHGMSATVCSFGERLPAACGQLTLSDLAAATLDALIELGKGVECGYDLDGANGIEHVGIVTRGSTETAIWMQAREDKVKNAGSGKGIGMTEKMQGRQPPVEAVQAQMFGEPVLELVFALERVSAGLRVRELARPGTRSSSYAQCRDSGCSGRACRRRGSFRPACGWWWQRARAQKQETCLVWAVAVEGGRDLGLGRRIACRTTGNGPEAARGRRVESEDV